MDKTVFLGRIPFTILLQYRKQVLKKKIIEQYSSILPANIFYSL